MKESKKRISVKISVKYERYWRNGFVKFTRVWSEIDIEIDEIEVYLFSEKWEYW